MFVLRFRERCSQSKLQHIQTGTETQTYVRSEHGDTDPGHNSFRSLPVVCVASTKTSENAVNDTDDCTSQGSSNGKDQFVLNALLAATRTVTEADLEQADNDHTQNLFNSFPKGVQ